MSEAAGQLIAPSPGTLLAISMISDELRCRMLVALATRPYDVGSLAQEVGVERSVASKHLSRMRDAGMVGFVSNKKLHIYRLTPSVEIMLDGDLTELGIRPSRAAALKLVWRRPLAPSDAPGLGHHTSRKR